MLDIRSAYKYSFLLLKAKIELLKSDNRQIQANFFLKKISRLHFFIIIISSSLNL